MEALEMKKVLAPSFAGPYFRRVRSVLRRDFQTLPNSQKPREMLARRESGLRTRSDTPLRVFHFRSLPCALNPAGETEPRTVNRSLRQRSGMLAPLAAATMRAPEMASCETGARKRT